jgi:hypothetical protein
VRNFALWAAFVIACAFVGVLTFIFVMAFVLVAYTGWHHRWLDAGISLVLLMGTAWYLQAAKSLLGRIWRRLRTL